MCADSATAWQDGDGNREALVATGGTPDGVGWLRPVEIARRDPGAFGRAILEDLQRHHTGLFAAGIAFRAFLALFSTLVVTTSALVLAQPADEIILQTRRVTLGLPFLARGVIVGQVEQIVNAETSQLRITFFVFLGLAVWVSASAMQGLMDAITVVNVEQDDRGWARRRLMALGLTLGALAFMATVVAVITGYESLFRRIGFGAAATAMAVAAELLTLAVMMSSALFVLYRIAPPRRPATWRWAWPGAVAATLVWLGGTEAFAQLVERAGAYNVRYGAVAGVAVLLLWLLLTAWSVLFGATLNARIERLTALDTTAGPDRSPGSRGAVVADVVPDAPRD